MLFCDQIEFEDESWLSVRREDVYKASEELPLKVQQRLVSEEPSWWLLAPTSCNVACQVMLLIMKNCPGTKRIAEMEGT